MATRTHKPFKAHVAIHVRDLRESIEFYRKMWGIEAAKVRRGYAKFDVQNPPLNFTLNEVPFPAGGGAAPERRGLSHLGIQVQSTEEVLAIRERWKREGLAVKDEMNTECCYALQDKAWVTDPDENEWEVFVALKDNLAATQAAESGACCGTNCCAPAETPEAQAHARTL